MYPNDNHTTYAYESLLLNHGNIFMKEDDEEWQNFTGFSNRNTENWKGTMATQRSNKLNFWDFESYRKPLIQKGDKSLKAVEQKL